MIGAQAEAKLANKTVRNCDLLSKILHIPQIKFFITPLFSMVYKKADMQP